MSYPALEEFQTDPGRTYARWCVLMALQPLLTHDTPTAMKLDVVHRGRDPAECSHGWKDRHGRCVMCGEPIPEPQPEEGHDEPR